MSIHPSFGKSGGTMTVKRSVMKRFERIEELKKRGQFKAGDSVYGLRKTKPPV